MRRSGTWQTGVLVSMNIICMIMGKRHHPNEETSATYATSVARKPHGRSAWQRYATRRPRGAAAGQLLHMKSVKRDDDARFHLNGHDDIIASKTQLHNKLPEIISGNKLAGLE